MLTLNPPNNPQLGTLSIPISQMRKLRLPEDKPLVCSRVEWSGRARSWTLICLRVNNYERFPPLPHVPWNWKAYSKRHWEVRAKRAVGPFWCIPKSQELCGEARSPQEQELGVTRSESTVRWAIFLHPRRHEKALREAICNSRKTLGNPTEELILCSHVRFKCS